MKSNSIIIAATIAVAISLSAKAEEIKVIVSHGNSVVTRGEGMSLERMTTERRKHGQSFTWFELEGERYLITDPAITERIEKLYEPSAETRAAEKELEQQERELSLRERSLDREEEELDRQMDRLDDDAEQARQQLEKRMKVLEEKQKILERESERLDAMDERNDKLRDAEEEKADQALRPLLEESIRNGTAKHI